MTVELDELHRRIDAVRIEKGEDAAFDVAVNLCPNVSCDQCYVAIYADSPPNPEDYDASA